MSDDQKDRFGDKLHDAEKAQEDLFFAKRDREILEKMKAQTGALADEPARALAKGRCPRCGEPLVGTSRHDVAIDECPHDHGVWLDESALQTLLKRESTGWLARILGRPR